MERFVTIVNGWKPLTIIAKRSILDVAAALDTPLTNHLTNFIDWYYSLFSYFIECQLLIVWDWKNDLRNVTKLRIFNIWKKNMLMHIQLFLVTNPS